MAWFGNMTYDDRNSLSRVIRTARRLTGVDLPDLRELVCCRVKSRFRKLIDNPIVILLVCFFRTAPVSKTIPQPGLQRNELPN